MSGKGSGGGGGGCFSYLVPGIIIAVAATAGILYWKLKPSQVNSFWPGLAQFIAESPFNATTPAEADRWPNTGHGLAMTLQNALESKYDSYFNLAVQQWNNGTPDCLTLSTTMASAPDANCTPVDGIIKVCNGNYGATGWYGINYVLTNGKWITASQAEMNDYYLDKASKDRIQYTMCHEIGHGAYLCTVWFWARQRKTQFLNFHNCFSVYRFWVTSY